MKYTQGYQHCYRGRQGLMSPSYVTVPTQQNANWFTQFNMTSDTNDCRDASWCNPNMINQCINSVTSTDCFLFVWLPSHVMCYRQLLNITPSFPPTARGSSQPIHLPKLYDPNFLTVYVCLTDRLTDLSRGACAELVCDLGVLTGRLTRPRRKNIKGGRFFFYLYIRYFPPTHINPPFRSTSRHCNFLLCVGFAHI